MLPHTKPQSTPTMYATRDTIEAHAQTETNTDDDITVDQRLKLEYTMREVIRRYTAYRYGIILQQRLDGGDDLREMFPAFCEVLDDHETGVAIVSFRVDETDTHLVPNVRQRAGCYAGRGSHSTLNQRGRDGCVEDDYALAVDCGSGDWDEDVVREALSNQANSQHQSIARSVSTLVAPLMYKEQANDADSAFRQFCEMTDGGTTVENLKPSAAALKQTRH